MTDAPWKDRAEVISTSGGGVGQGSTESSQFMPFEEAVRLLSGMTEAERGTILVECPHAFTGRLSGRAIAAFATRSDYPFR